MVVFCNYKRKKVVVAVGAAWLVFKEWWCCLFGYKSNSYYEIFAVKDDEEND